MALLLLAIGPSTPLEPIVTDRSPAPRPRAIRYALAFLRLIAARPKYRYPWLH